MALGPGIARWPLLPRLWRWRGHIFELALFIGAYLVYRFSLGVGHSDLETAALANAERVVGLEKSLGFFGSRGGRPGLSTPPRPWCASLTGFTLPRTGPSSWPPPWPRTSLTDGDITIIAV